MGMKDPLSDLVGNYGLVGKLAKVAEDYRLLGADDEQIRRAVVIFCKHIGLDAKPSAHGDPFLAPYGITEQGVRSPVAVAELIKTPDFCKQMFVAGTKCGRCSLPKEHEGMHSFIFS